MMKLQKLALTALASMALAACGGGSENTLTGTGGGAGGGTGGGGTGGGGTGGTQTVTMGNGTGAGFVAGEIGLSATSLPAGGSASMTVTLVDQTNTLVTDSYTINFSSPCAAGGLANIVESSITTATGSATATYSATGCSGDDLITATADVGGNVLRATGTVNVAAAAVGSIEYVSANPENIGLQGTGGAGRQETSTVRFRVTDATGGPVVGADVDFALNTSVGGIILNPVSAVSGSDGFVQTVVSAGTVATSVRITATVTGSSPVIATQSDQLTITTGIPDQNSVSLSFETLNTEGWNIDGLSVETTIRLSDRYNNPVPDGTAVTFSTEGGQIGGSCVTQTTAADGAGVCSVTFVTQAPRPPNGRVTVLASVIGEESFTDLDGNGVFNGSDIAENIGEPFQDDDESGTYDSGSETFRDFNQNGVRDDENAPDYAGYNGLLCDPTGGAVCSANETLFVSGTGVVLMSSGAASCTDDVGGALDATGGPASVTFLIGDNKGNGTGPQPLPLGTTIRGETSNGSLVGPTNYTVPNTNFDGPLAYGFTVDPDTTPDTGTLSVTITSPSGIQTFCSVTVTD